VSASPTISATPSVTAVLTATYTATPFSQEVRLLRNALNPAKGESVPLDIRMPTRGKLRVTVYSRLGDKIVELINQDAGPGIIENLAWDGKNASHNIVASGIYVIYVEAADQKVKRLIAVIK
jgi:flagellar hook assembly protein FlgD